MEELEIINSWASSKFNFVGTPERELQIKIQYMIHNYQENKQTVFVRGEERDLSEFDNE